MKMILKGLFNPKTLKDLQYIIYNTPAVRTRQEGSGGCGRSGWWRMVEVMVLVYEGRGRGDGGFGA